MADCVVEIPLDNNNNNSGHVTSAEPSPRRRDEEDDASPREFRVRINFTNRSPPSTSACNSSTISESDALTLVAQPRALPSYGSLDFSASNMAELAESVRTGRLDINNEHTVSAYLRTQLRLSLYSDVLNTIRTRLPREYALISVEEPSLPSVPPTPRGNPAAAAANEESLCMQQIACIQMSLMHIDAIHTADEPMLCSLCQQSQVRQGRALIELSHLCYSQTSQSVQLNVGILCLHCSERRLGVLRAEKLPLRAYSVEFLTKRLSKALEQVMRAADLPRPVLSEQGDRTFYCTTCGNPVGSSEYLTNSRPPYVVYLETRPCGLLRVSPVCSIECEMAFKSVKNLRECNISGGYNSLHAAEPYDGVYTARWRVMHEDEIAAHFPTGLFKLHQCGSVDCSCRLTRDQSERFTRTYITPHECFAGCKCARAVRALAQRTLPTHSSAPELGAQRRTATTSSSGLAAAAAPVEKSQSERLRARVEDTSAGQNESEYRDRNYRWLRCIAERVRALPLYDDVLDDDADTRCVRCHKHTNRYCTRCTKARFCSDKCVREMDPPHSKVCHDASDADEVWSRIVYC